MRLSNPNAADLEEAILQSLHTLAVWSWNMPHAFDGLTCTAVFVPHNVRLTFSCDDKEVESVLNNLEPTKDYFPNDDTLYDY